MPSLHAACTKEMSPMPDLKRYVLENIDQFEVLSISTNKVLAFTYEGKEYVAKKQTLTEQGLSPFWQMMKDVFGSSFARQRECVPNICRLLKKNPHIRPADLILADAQERLQVFVRMPGKGWEPDTFPLGAEIANQLGQFIGFNHAGSYNDIKLPGTGQRGRFEKQLLLHMENVISMHWNGGDALDMAVKAHFEKLRKKDIPCGGFSLIMADISANQFLFEDRRISACVDLDAYVIGPRLWELALLCNCVQDIESFKKGYEQYQPMPNMGTALDFYPFLLALHDIWTKEEMRMFFKGKALS